MKRVYPRAARARYEVAKAVRQGRLTPIKQCICVDCGKPANAYDHRDYDKPLEVQPVCMGCNTRRGPAINHDAPPVGYWGQARSAAGRSPDTQGA